MNEVEIDRRDTASRPETWRSEHPLLARHHAHDGLLFKGRHTTLQLREDGLTGSYADIGTLIPGFDPGIEWFSMIWGDYHDNILAMQLDEAVMGPLPRVPHAGIVPLGEYVDGLKEYRLDGPIAERLQMEFPEHNFYRHGAATGVVREVYFHDNCGWRVTPVHEDVLRAVARQQLALHEEYLGCVGGLMAYVEPLCELLTSGDSVKLKSLRRGELRVTCGPEGFLERRSSQIWRPKD